MTNLSTLCPYLLSVVRLDHELSEKFQNLLIPEPTLRRSLVSFQANKKRSVYRWYKYKEAFSASLVEYLLSRYQINQGKILDPFAGSGTSLLVASSLGLDADGIELLPIGINLVKIKKIIQNPISSEDLRTLKCWSIGQVWKDFSATYSLNELKITMGAYPKETKQAIEQYVSRSRLENQVVQSILYLALLAVLESVSYTRKDGQYLRWDYRSSHKMGKTLFDKGNILSFDLAVSDKLADIIADLEGNLSQLELFSNNQKIGNFDLYEGSCLDLMPRLSDNIYDAIITSPPYCNRYDYTRTYALELALLGIQELELIELRQKMLTCTVENRAKDLCVINPNWIKALEVVNQQELLQAILEYLNYQKKQGLLNNNGIVRMVQGYFQEMASIIFECYRLLKVKGVLIMVNDNVRYAGVSISVDLILSNIAELFGFQIEEILVLPNGKGNSSQQMGQHGRESLRKCVYVWRKVL